MEALKKKYFSVVKRHLQQIYCAGFPGCRFFQYIFLAGVVPFIDILVKCSFFYRPTIYSKRSFIGIVKGEQALHQSINRSTWFKAFCFAFFVYPFLEHLLDKFSILIQSLPLSLALLGE